MAMAENQTPESLNPTFIPPMVGNDEASLRRITLLEARMLGVGDSDDNNSNSCSSTIGFIAQAPLVSIADAPPSAYKKRGRDASEVPSETTAVAAQLSPDRVSVPPITLDAMVVVPVNDNVSSSSGVAARGRSGGGGKYRATSLNGMGNVSSTINSVIATTTLSPAKPAGPSPSKRDGQKNAQPGGVLLPPKPPKSKDIQSYFRPRNDDDDATMVVNSPKVNELVQRAERLEREKQDLQAMGHALRDELGKVHDELVKTKEDFSCRGNQLSEELVKFIELEAVRDWEKAREHLAQEELNLGKLVVQDSGCMPVQGGVGGGGVNRNNVENQFKEVWQEGRKARELQQSHAELLQRKIALDGRRKAAVKALRISQSGTSAELEALQEDEVTRAHGAVLKREEMALAEEKMVLESQKLVHLREVRRVHSEDRSPFSNRPTLVKKYKLQKLIGKGGFSEVWKAYDLQEFREVAVKVHQLSHHWSEAKKQSYIKHATREYQIHKAMSHDRVVALYDVFEINHDSFATVLEYCTGMDLEQHLKAVRTLPEKDARPILLQIMCALQYINRPQEGSHAGIIHYDLKPANILFDCNGDIKITDFGLSKIIDPSADGTSMELTSQGAGTYWYLPPECFMIGSTARISNKVDVWSVGIIFFQIIYGMRPFGEGQTQNAILNQGTMLRAKSVEFPTKPTVSDEAKDFLRKCLTHNQVERPDVSSLCCHPYIRPAKGGRGGSSN